MPLLGRRRESDQDDSRSRELVLIGEPVVTADSFVVLVDLVARYDQVEQPDGPGLGWDQADEIAVQAVAVATLRVAAEQAERADVLEERARLADPVARALDFAPVAAGFRPTLVSLEVRQHDPDASRSSEFRILG